MNEPRHPMTSLWIDGSARVVAGNAWLNGDEAARDGRLRASGGAVVKVRYVVCPLCVHEHGVRSPAVNASQTANRQQKL